MFTLDPDHRDVLWYYVDSTGASPTAPSRCTWQDGILRVERHAGAGWTRHSISVAGALLLHVTELRTSGKGGGAPKQSAAANGRHPAFVPFMTSTFRRT